METLRANLLRVLQNRFKEIPEEVRQVVGQQADLPTLDRWFETGLNVKTLEEMRAVLGLKSGT